VRSTERSMSRSAVAAIVQPKRRMPVAAISHQAGRQSATAAGARAEVRRATQVIRVTIDTPPDTRVALAASWNEGRHMAAELYCIRVKGHLDSCWADWLGGLTLVHEQDGTTVLSGALPDQAALHGVLIMIRDLGLPLLALYRVAPDAEAAAGDEERERWEGTC
jgi:hypothetical protein